MNTTALAEPTVSTPPAGDTGRRAVDVSISIRTLLLVVAVVAVASALVSIANVLLMIFVSIFSVAVLSPVVSAIERRFGWSRGLAAAALVSGVVLVLGAIVLVVAQAATDAVRDLGRDLPALVEDVRRSDAGTLVDGSGSLETLQEHASEIAGGVGQVSGGVAHVGISAFGAVTLVFSVLFLTLFGLVDEPRIRSWIGSLLFRETRERYVRLADRIVHTTSRYMLGNLAISAICGTVYGVTALILGVPYPLALGVIAAVLDLVPSIGATIAGIVVVLVSLSVSVEATVVFVVVIVLYQQIENYVLQPTIIGRAAQISGFTVLASVLTFGALFGLIGAVIGVPIAAAIQIVVQELTAARRARVVAADIA